MDILIKLNKGIPKTHESLVIDEDNEVRIYGTGVVIGEAIELPPHGDLVERSKVHEAVTQAYSIEDVPSIIDQLVPTILEASE